MRKHLRTGLLAAAAILAAEGQALAIDCQADFAKLMQTRQSVIERVNGFAKRKPTAPQACGTFRQLSSANNQALAFVTKNKEWCQIPDTIAEGLQNEAGQIGKVQGQACGAAAKQAQMQKVARSRAAQAQQGGPSGLPGSGVRLPGGAL